MAKSCMVARLNTCQKLELILARFLSDHHTKILHGNILITCQKLALILARFLSDHHDQILHGSTVEVRDVVVDESPGEVDCCHQRS